MHPIRHIAFTNELRFTRPREEVFEAFLETDKWFQISYGEERLKAVVNDRRVGGQIYEDWGDGTGKLYGTIGWWDPPTGYSQTSEMLGGGITLTHRYEFADDGEDTVLRHDFNGVRADLGRDGGGDQQPRLTRILRAATPGVDRARRGDPATGALSATLV